MVAQITGNPQNETIATLLAAAQLLGHQDSWIENHTPRSGRKSDDDVFMSIMEWISQCFVRDKSGDVAAVASELIKGIAPPLTAASKPGTASAPAPLKISYASAAASKPKAPSAPPTAIPMKIQLLVANNKGKNVTEENKTFGEAFVAVLNEKIKNDGTFYSGVTNHANLTKAVDDINQVVVEYGWSRVTSKIFRVKEAFREEQRQSAVGKILDLWVQKQLFVEEDFVHPVDTTDAGGRNRTPKQILDIRIAALKTHAVEFMNVNSSVQTFNTAAQKLALLHKMCNNCKYLLQAFDGVMKRNPKTPMPVSATRGKDEITLEVFKKFCRRLRRVLRYSAGPQLFLIKGRSILKNKIVQAKGDSNSIEFANPVWVANNTNVATLFSTTAQQEIIITKDTFINWFRRDIVDKSTASEDNKKTAINSITNYCNSDKFKNRWRPTLHCEITLLAYLYLSKTSVIGNAIGVSKLNCFACNVYTDTLKTGSSGTEYNMTGTSGKFHHQWLIPNSAVFDRLPALKIASIAGNKKVMTETRERINKFLVGIIGSDTVGSDSSTASGGMDANEVYLLHVSS